MAIPSDLIIEVVNEEATLKEVKPIILESTIITGIQGPKGDTGGQGPIGPQGIQGPPGTDATYLHEQFVPQATWTVNHNLNKYCSVTIVDSAGSAVFGNVEYLDMNSVQLVFSSAFSGKAFCN